MAPRLMLYYSVFVRTGNAGLLLLAPPGRSQPADALRRENEPMDPLRVETRIGQKLQLIGDQFYQEHMMVSLHQIVRSNSSPKHNGSVQ